MFDEFRHKEMESIKGQKIKLTIDRDYAYDYEKGECLIFKDKAEMLE